MKEDERPGAYHLGLCRPGEYEWAEYMEQADPIEELDPKLGRFPIRAIIRYSSGRRILPTELDLPVLLIQYMGCCKDLGKQAHYVQATHPASSWSLEEVLQNHKTMYRARTVLKISHLPLQPVTIRSFLQQSFAIFDYLLCYLDKATAKHSCRTKLTGLHCLC